MANPVPQGQTVATGNQYGVAVAALATARTALNDARTAAMGGVTTLWAKQVDLNNA